MQAKSFASTITEMQRFLTERQSEATAGFAKAPKGMERSQVIATKCVKDFGEAALGEAAPKVDSAKMMQQMMMMMQMMG